MLGDAGFIWDLFVECAREVAFFIGMFRKVICLISIFVAMEMGHSIRGKNLLGLLSLKVCVQRPGSGPYHYGVYAGIDRR